MKVIQVVCLVAFLSGIPRADAITLSELESRRDALRAQTESIETEVESLRSGLAAARQSIQDRMNENSATVRDLSTHFEGQATQRIRGLQAAREERHFISSHVRRINSVYSEKIEAYLKTFAELVTRFKAYQGTEKANRDLVEKNTNKVRNAKSYAEAFPPQTEVYNLLEEENRIWHDLALELATLRADLKRAYLYYGEQRDPYDEPMNRLGYPRLAPPWESLARVHADIKWMNSYGEKRAQYFSSLKEKRFAEYGEKTKELTAARKSELVKAYYDLDLYGETARNWNNWVLAQFKKRNDYNRGPARIPVGVRKKLGGLYDIYLEVLSYRERCSSLQPVLGKESPYTKGCSLLGPLLADAQRFFEHDAWETLSWSLVAARYEPAPAHLKDLEARLRALEEPCKQGMEHPEIILRAIKLHDQLLDEWNQFKNEHSTEGEAL